MIAHALKRVDRKKEHTAMWYLSSFLCVLYGEKYSYFRRGGKSSSIIFRYINKYMGQQAPNSFLKLYVIIGHRKFIPKQHLPHYTKRHISYVLVLELCTVSSGYIDSPPPQ